MQGFFNLVMPIFMPSWQFFNEIAPSARIEFSCHTQEDMGVHQWQELQLRPEKLHFVDNIKRIFFNPDWNYALYIMNCAEKQIIKPSQHNENEIFTAIKNYLPAESKSKANFLKFRLVFVSKGERGLKRNVLFESQLEKINFYEY